MPDDLEDEQTDPAERRIAQREEAKAQRELAVYKAGLHELSNDQRAALLAVAGDDLSTDALKAKAESLGFLKEAEVPPPPPEENPNLQAEERMSAAAAGSAPPPPALDAAKAIYDKAQYVTSPAELSRLQQELVSSLRSSGVPFGQVDHTAVFEPTG